MNFSCALDLYPKGQIKDLINHHYGGEVEMMIDTNKHESLN